jgi:branched-subunit amino acid transport protein
MTASDTVLAIIGMALITLLTRGFFLLPRRDMPLPHWLREALRYAPLGALAALVVPEVAMKDGALITTWQDARLYATAAGLAYFYWRRGILGTIVVGTTVMLGLRLGLGW